MTMKYRIEHASGDSKDYRATSWGEFRNDAAQCDGTGYTFFVDGESVSKKDALEAADAAADAHRAKKLETHREITIRHGVTRGATKSYSKVWVRK